jgi:hypothetical protein
MSSNKAGVVAVEVAAVVAVWLATQALDAIDRRINSDKAK